MWVKPKARSMWAAIRWAKGRSHRSAGPYESEVPNELPPGVVEARLISGWDMVDPVAAVSVPQLIAADAARSSTDRKGSPRPSPETQRVAPRTPGAFARAVITEAGEERFSARAEGPFVPYSDASAPKRGSASLAEEIAGSTDRTMRAVSNFNDLVYARTTVAAKESLFNLWERLCLKRGVSALPVSTENLLCNAAILREAGYRSTMAYILEAKDRHLRAGFPWTPVLQAAFQDARRASKRALGSVKRAEEVKLEYWVWLAEKFGHRPAEDEASPHAPADSLDMIFIGHAFLLREVELASMFLDKWSVQMNSSASTVTFLLPATKADTMANGVKRTLGCTCSSISNRGCPVCAVKRVVHNQLARLRYSRLEDVPCFGTTVWTEGATRGLHSENSRGQRNAEVGEDDQFESSYLS